jgi:DNA polymerase-3 subunit epsilon
MKMRYAITEVATNGLIDWKLAADAATQPRLAQLAMIYIDSEMAAGDYTTEITVRSDGWAMEAGASAANGLTDDCLAMDGKPVQNAVQAYRGAIDTNYVIVSFSTAYVLKIMRGECRRAGIEDRYEHTPSIDLMRALTDVCQMPYAGGKKGFKQPKMTEACAHFGMVCPAVRDAVANARISMELFSRLVGLGRLPAPKLPSAKD